MKAIKTLSIIFLVLTFTKCASIPFKSNPPFTITKAIYQNWIKGIKGVSGVNVTISYTSEKEIDFKTLFFRGKKRKVNSQKSNRGEKVLLVRFNNSNKNKIDFQLHADAKKEFGNKPSKKETDFPFEIKDTEAILSYEEEGEVKYFKIEHLEKGKQITLR